MADISKIRIPSTTAEYTEYNVKDTVSGYVTSSELGTAATQNYTTSITSGSTDLVTSDAVYTAIANLPEPMIFKGTLGTGGTITSLPAASSSNEGFTYKVITAGTYASQTAEVGDLFISNGSAWILVPSGDETSADTWRAIKINGVEQLGNSITTGSVDFINGTNTTVSYDSTNKTVAVSATDSKVRQVGGVVTNSTFPVLLAGSADSETTETASINKSSGIWFNPYRQAFISGFSASATGSSSAAIGINATAVGTSSQAFGNGTRASGNAAHATGIITVASGDYSQAAGHATTANHKAQHVFGEYNVADTSTAAATSRGNYVEIVGNGTGDSARSNARTLDWSGNETIAGQLTDKWGVQSIRTIAESDYQQLSPEEKNNGTIYCRTGADVAASLDHKVTQTNTTSSGNYRLLLSYSSDNATRTEEARKSANLYYNPNVSALTAGNRTGTNGSNSIVVGQGTASGDYSSACGWFVTASAHAAHAEGANTTASGYASHAEGQYTTAGGRSQHVFGEYNIVDQGSSSSTRGNYVEIVGNGVSNALSNARTLDWGGTETLAGSLMLAGTTSDIQLTGTGNYWYGTTTSLKTAVSSLKQSLSYFKDCQSTFSNSAWQGVYYADYDISSIVNQGYKATGIIPTDVNSNRPCYGYLYANGAMARVCTTSTDIGGTTVKFRVTFQKGESL